jgi:MFS transporter, DHA3 family, macrolide efflux protein
MQQFLILWLGQLCSLVGSQLTGFALGIWVYQQTHSTTLFALLIGLNVLPVIVLSPLIGTIVDRWNRRTVMLLSDFGAGLSTVALAIALKTNYLPIGLIAVLIALNATFSSFMRPAYTAATTQLVAAKDLDRASGLMQIGTSVAQLIAPILGGALLKLIGLPGIIGIDVITFLIAVLTQCIVRIPPPTPNSKLSQSSSSLLKDFFEALQFLKQRPGLLALLGFFVVKNFLTSIVYVSTTPYVLSFTSEIVLGSILSVGGLGMVVGGIILSVYPIGQSRILTIQIFALLGGITLILLTIKNSILVFMVGSFLFFLGIPFIHGSGQVIFQKKVPQPLQGRIFAFNEAVAGSSVLLGYLAAGPLNDVVFEPWMQPDGWLAGTIGPILGTGPGRGVALLFIVLGMLHSALALFIQLYTPLRQVEWQLTDRAEEPYEEFIPISPEPNFSPSLLSPKEDIMMEISNPIHSYQRSVLAHPDDIQPAMEPVISIQKLNHFFGKGDLAKQVLIDINLSIKPGEIVIMTGPSGSGKTTLLTLMGALRSVQEGSLKILGKELNQATNQKLVEVRRNIGYIFQAHNLLPFMTARQNVRMSLALQSKVDRAHALQKVDEVLNAVGLGNHLNYYPEKLSGGQKQRVAIARALVNEPTLILADEPTASLDSKTGREVVELMYRLAKEQNCTIILVTHDNRILDIADRIINLEDGRLLPAVGQTTQLHPSTSLISAGGNAPILSSPTKSTPELLNQTYDLNSLRVESASTETLINLRQTPSAFPKTGYSEVPSLSLEQPESQLRHLPPEADSLRVESDATSDATETLLNLRQTPSAFPETGYSEVPSLSSEQPESQLGHLPPGADSLRVESDATETLINLRQTPSAFPETEYPEVSSLSLEQPESQLAHLPPGVIQPHKRYKIVCIDDSPAVLCSLRAFLSDDLFSVYLIDDPIQSLIQLIKIKPDMVILDINMPRLDGYQLCSLLRHHEKFKHIPVIVITGDPKLIDLQAAQKVGVSECLVKPFDRSDLMVKLFPHLT